MTTMLATITYCIVGCNTGAPDQQALHVLACNAETGAAKIVQTVTGLQGTTYFAIDAARKNLYSMITVPPAASAAATPSTNEKPTAAIVKFALEGHTIGAMTKLCDLPCEAPCHIALSPDGKTLGFAAYSSGTCGRVDIDGRNLKTFVFPNDEVGPNAKRQQKAFAHQAFFLDPNGIGPADTMGVVDLGCDRIWFFDSKTLERKANLAIKADPGDGPRHTIVPPHAGNKILYTLNELASSVTIYTATDKVPAVTSRRGADKPLAYTRLASYSMLPADFNRWEPDGETLATKAAAIKLTADGKILMASNRGHDSIAFYEVGPTGTLTLKNIAKLTGKFPRDFELMPGEKFMVVGHKMSNEIQVYAFDRAACTLTPVESPIPAWRPLCFKFL